MSIDNQPLAIDTSPVPSNVAVVIYDCSSGSGNIEYNDRLRLLEPFIDVTPYASFVNAWITQASALAFPITLVQAKMVKIGLVDGLFNSKRQLPVVYAGNTWEATDQAVVEMQSAIMAWDVANAVTVGDAQFADNVNAMSVQTPLTQSVAASAISPSTDNIPDIFLTNTDGRHDTIADGSWQATGSGVTGVSGGGVTQQPNVAMSKAPINAPPAIAGPPVDWPPLNSTVMVRLTMAQMRELIWGILWRRNQLQTTRLVKTQIINSLTTLAGVIAYDVTSGWDTTASPPPPTGTVTGGGVTGGGGDGGGPPVLASSSILVTRAGLWLTSGSSSINGLTMAITVDASALNLISGGSKTRVVLKGTNLQFTKCYIGPRVLQTSGQSSDKYYTPSPDPGGLVQLTFNGQPGGIVASVAGGAGILVSDEVAQGIDGTNGLVVYLVGVPSGGGTADSGTPPGFHAWYAAGDTALNPNRVSGYSNGGDVAYAVNMIQAEYPNVGYYPRLPMLKYSQGISGWGGVTLAISIDSSTISPTRAGDKTKISLQGYGPFTFDKCYIGPRSPQHPFGFEMVSSSQLLFGGQPGATITAGQTLVSDELAHGVDGTNGIVVRLRITGGGVYQSQGVLGITSYWAPGDAAALLTGAANWSSSVPSAIVLSQISGFYS